jgi:hypothetical protein
MAVTKLCAEQEFALYANEMAIRAGAGRTPLAVTVIGLEREEISFQTHSLSTEINSVLVNPV